MKPRPRRVQESEGGPEDACGFTANGIVCGYKRWFHSRVHFTHPHEFTPLEATHQWRPIPGFDAYEIHPDGLVRRAKPGNGAQVGHVLRPKITERGTHVALHRGDGTTFAASIGRLVCHIFNGPPPHHRSYAKRRNNNMLDNRASNLYWAAGSKLQAKLPAESRRR